MSEQPTLESLKADGSEGHDPARFHYLEALARRMQAQPPAVQALLQQRLQAAVADYAARAGTAPATPPAPHVATCTTDSPLALLNRDLAARAQAEADHVRTSESTSTSEMKSVRQFSEVWSKISAEQQVTQALHKAPENAGPLNSHKLMLRSLGLMRTLSPDYLRRFMAQMDALLWLEQTNADLARPAPRAPRTSKPRR
ncbi:DUF2894 domain-containing protein [Acidovorax sp. Root217]|uniref:DUF2894 domain-containing protein n=1 Tax=Acidovorax sp. Root217 TaxID=1736492 RepID=UPI00070CB58B|nr:DUF2894 domain-containing protein [Acidovorax sp. Root217]KRC14863.1 hypothetical protein ASE31_08985 [Acidovorax sp. Root217]